MIFYEKVIRLTIKFAGFLVNNPTTDEEFCQNNITKIETHHIVPAYLRKSNDSLKPFINKTPRGGFNSRSVDYAFFSSFCSAFRVWKL